MTFRRLFFFAVVTGFAFMQPPANAAAQVYQTWENPDKTAAQSSETQAANEARLKAIIERMNTMLDQAEKDRAADPRFLKDLRGLISELAGGSSSPWPEQVLLDEFTDGDYAQSPEWTVGMGRYWVEKDWGLRNALDEVKATTSGSSSKDAAAQIFGQILNQALGGGGTSGSTSSSTGGIQPTSIFSPTPVTNAFSIAVDLSSWVGEGEFIMGPYQGSDRGSGYRLSYKVGAGLAVRIKSRSGVRTIAVEPGPFTLEDKNVHSLLWTRSSDGTMRVELDGKTIIEVRDVSFLDPFDGFGMATRGGDFIIKRVSIHGTSGS